MSHLQQTQGASAGASQDQHRKEMDELQQQATLLAHDKRMLRQFQEDNTVADASGLQMQPVWEASSAHNASAHQPQPVVRVYDGDACSIFTRTQWNDPQSALIIRIRTGWDLLKAELLANTLSPAGCHLKWDVFVCTHAQRPYAREVCA